MQPYHLSVNYCINSLSGFNFRQMLPNLALRGTGMRVCFNQHFLQRLPTPHVQVFSIYVVLCVVILHNFIEDLSNTLFPLIKMCVYIVNEKDKSYVVHVCFLRA